MTSRVEFARWRSDFASGGNRYDDELTAALRDMGVNVREHDVTGPWPSPELHDRERFAALLAGGNDWLVDNIVGSAAPEALSAAVTAGRRATVLMHYFPGDDPLLSADERARLETTEAEAVCVASNVVVTSAWAAAEVSTRYGRHDAVVAQPGVQPARIAPGSARDGGPPMMLWLARLTTQKDPLTFVDALTLIQDLDWTAQLVGPETVQPALSAEVHHRLTRAGLDHRVEVAGPRTGDALEATWMSTDLLVHTSRSETFGMVVSEALSRGIPSVVARGTGAVEAQKVGASFARGDAAALACELRSWLTNSHLQELWRKDASLRRSHLPTWEDTARIIAAALIR